MDEVIQKGTWAAVNLITAWFQVAFSSL